MSNKLVLKLNFGNTASEIKKEIKNQTMEANPRKKKFFFHIIC